MALLSKLFFNFLFVFLLLLCYTFCVSVCANSAAETKKKDAELFSFEEISNVINNDGEIINTQNVITLQEINLPVFFVTAKENIMLAAAEAKYTKKGDNGKKYLNVVTKYFKADKKEEWNDNAFMDVNKNWKTQLAIKNEKEENLFFTIRAATVNADGDNIYLFLLNFTDIEVSNKLKVKLVKGEIEDKVKTKTIKWETKELNFKDSKTEVKEKLNVKTMIWDANGYAFLTKEKTIICFVGGYFTTKKEYVTLYFQFTENKQLNELDLLSAESSTAGRYLSFFQWEENIFGTFINEQNGGGKVMVFNPSGEKIFTEGNNSIVCLRDFLKDKINFTAVTIKGINVLLSIQLKINTDGTSDVYLWITDGTRVSDVGKIIEDKFKGIFYGSVLFINDKLFLLYQISKTEPEILEKNKKIFITQLNQELEKIKTIVDIWKNNNNTIEKLCNNIHTTAILCSTDGLVAYLSVSDSDNNWQEKYLNINPTVTTNSKGEAKKKGNGFSFSGEGVGAQWNVKKLTDELKYNFTDFGFTLVTTVTIDKISGEVDNSLLGVYLNENTKRFGLFCSKQKQWAVNIEKESFLIDNGKECEEGKVYSVAFVLNDTGNFDIFVDWEQLTDLKNEKMKINKNDKITQFYFGVDNKVDKLKHSNATITNVLLYNRPFTKNEISELKTRQETKVLPKSNNGGAGTEKETDSEGGKLNNDDDIMKETDTSLETLDSLTTTTEKNEGNVPTHIKDNAVSDIVGGFLFLLVMGVGVREFLIIA